MEWFNDSNARSNDPNSNGVVYVRRAIGSSQMS